jgi:HD-GYP domain-containing protein (c-di-GMP phosphodiesterase class II)
MWGAFDNLSASNDAATSQSERSDRTDFAEHTVADSNNAALNNDSFVAVAVETLCSSPTFDFDLYLPPDGPNASKLYRRSNVPCDAQDFQRLIEAGINTLYIPGSMAKVYRNYLKQHVLVNESIPVANRYEVLKDAARVTFCQALRSGDVSHATAAAEELGSQLAQLLNRNDLLLSDMVTVMLHDYSTFTHVTHVATFSIMLATKLGIHDLADLTEVAKGGLLHDIGKRFISIDILEKPGKLDGREQRVIRDHPRRGFAELCQRSDISWGALMMVYQHHERCQGGGYPVGSVAEEIHPWAKICAIADVFDAMSSNRSYHDGAAIVEVLTYFDRQAGVGFDKEMVQCWKAMVESTLQPS